MKLTKEKLIELHVKKELSQSKIADKFSTTRYYIRKNIYKWNLSTYEPLDIDAKELEKLYVEENRTQKEIADEYENISKSGIGYYLDKFDIDKSEEKKHKARVRKERENIIKNNAGSVENLQNLADGCKTVVDLAEKSGIERNTLYTLIEEGYIDFETRTERLEKLDDEETLRRLYVDENLTQEEIGNKFGCRREYVGKMLKKYNIEKSTYSISHDAEARRKMRVSTIENIKQRKGQFFPAYNPEACELIEEYGDKHGYDFQHAENGGEYHIKELGYWVDGYDPEENVVIEVDEPHHFNEDGKLCERDKRRQQEIEEHLNCKFIRIEP